MVGMSKKALKEFAFGLVVLAAVAYQTVFELPHSTHNNIKFAGVLFQAAIGVFVIVSGFMALARRKTAQ
jgi:hypothetical protein